MPVLLSPLPTTQKTTIGSNPLLYVSLPLPAFRFSHCSLFSVLVVLINSSNLCIYLFSFHISILFTIIFSILSYLWGTHFKILVFHLLFYFLANHIIYVLAVLVLRDFKIFCLTDDSGYSFSVFSTYA